MELTDNQFKKLKELTMCLIDENIRQLEKWGIQTHSPFEWLAYITEELGELSEAISDSEYGRGIDELTDINNVIKEAIQVATLSLKVAEMYMRVKER